VQGRVAVVVGRVDVRAVVDQQLQHLGADHVVHRRRPVHVQGARVGAVLQQAEGQVRVVRVDGQVQRRQQGRSAGLVDQRRARHGQHVRCSGQARSVHQAVAVFVDRRQVAARLLHQQAQRSRIVRPRRVVGGGVARFVDEAEVRAQLLDQAAHAARGGAPAGLDRNHEGRLAARAGARIVRGAAAPCVGRRAQRVQAEQQARIARGRRVVHGLPPRLRVDRGGVAAVGCRQ
jgi:hypothetical protein